MRVSTLPASSTLTAEGGSAFQNSWEKIAERLYHAELCEDLVVSEGEIERGETHTSDDVMQMIDDDLKKLSKPTKRRTQKLAVA